ncbi:MAG: hypothetical protein KC461_00155 [Dehalococcoidia bacterium]|nr:hypothetical protein [Dehalococcoidia bacterium]MCA9849051.1 hypothetical protein [Dehalococcoidia bacterium]
MDNAVALVQAYLRVNGYFTVAEYPVIEAARFGYRSLTDLDILALRFPGAGRLVPGRHALASRPAAVFAPDPILAAPDDAVDMLVGEVKEGRAELNPASHDPAVLSTVLARFGCCSLEETGPVVDALLRRGELRLPSGHLVRLAVFGSSVGTRPPHGVALVVSLGHVVDFLEDYLRDHWDVLAAAQFKDPALGFLVTLEKARRQRERGNGISGAQD